MSDVIESGFLAPGARSARLGAAVAALYGCAHGLAVNSCTSALHLTLMALGIGAGARVAVPGLVCPVVLNPLAYVGAHPVFVDVRPGDHQMDLEALRAAHETAPLAAAIVAHRYGHRQDLSAAVPLDIPIIEDDAQALGARVGSSTAPLQGIAAVTSFYATKMLATGCGGAMVTNDDRLASAAGRASDYYGAAGDEVRYNYRMPDLNAAVGLAQIAEFDALVAARRRLAAAYRAALDGRVEVVAPEDTSGSVWYRFVVRTRTPAERLRILERAQADSTGIGAIDIVMPPAQDAGMLASACSEWHRCVSLPLYPTLTDADQARVVATIREALS